MTLFVIHGRKIARILRKFREGFRAHSRFERNSGGVLGELWESSGRALAELWESSRRVLGEPADSCCCRKCPEPNWECMAQRSCGFFPRIFRPWRPKSVISPHPYPILNIFSAVSPIKIFGPDSKLAFFCNKLWNLKLVKKKWHFCVKPKDINRGNGRKNIQNWIWVGRDDTFCHSRAENRENSAKVPRGILRPTAL